MHSKRRAALQAVVAGVLYLALACAVYWPISPVDAHHVVGTCACSDAVQQTWFLQWVAFALGHGLNPLFSTYLNAPAGVNLAVNTSMPLLGFLGWPVTALSSPIAAFNLLLRLGLATSALSMFLVLRLYVRSGAAAFVGGLLFGFSPYMLGQGELHLFLVFLPLLPPLIPLIDRWLIRADRNPYACGALVGLLLGLEVLISAELAVIFLLLVVIALIPIAIRHHRLVRSRLPLLARGLATAAGVGLVFGGAVAWMFLAGPQRPVGPPHSVANLDSFHGDLLSLIVPSRPQLLRPSLLYRTANHFVRGNLHENGFYLGIPLLALLIVGCVWLRRNTLMLAIATVGVVSFVFSLGTRLTVANHVTPIRMPLVVFAHLPMLQEIGPTQFALAIQFAAAVLLALVLDHVLQRFRLAGLRAYAVLTALSVVVLVPLLPGARIPSVAVQTPPYFASSAVKEIPEGRTVLAYPYPYYSANVAMLWQTSSDMRFRLLGGEVYVPGPTRHSVNYPRADLPPALWNVLVQGGPNKAKHWHAPSSAQRTKLVADLRAYAGTHPFDAMVVATDTAQGRWVEALAASAFGAPTSVHGDIAVWLRPAAR